MRKFLLASTITMLSFAAFAEPVRVQRVSAPVYTETQAQPAVYQKQTVVRYNVPTCKNCQTTTTVSRVVGDTAEPVLAPAPCSTCNKCTTCGTPAPVAQKSCVFDNHKYAIGNPLFVLKEGQFSSNTVAGYWTQPKKITMLDTYDENGDRDAILRGRFDGWSATEQIMYGITDWLSLKVQGGYHTDRPKKSTWNLIPNHGPVEHHYSYEGTVGLQAHALDFCNIDLIVGLDATWGRAGYKKGGCKDWENYKLVTPYAILGGQVTKYVTPYLQASYVFAVDTKKELADDVYVLQPGFYIQPSKYWAIHPYITKTEHAKPEWNLGLDFYPYQNLVVGIEGMAQSLTNDPMDKYGVSGHVKMTF